MSAVIFKGNKVASLKDNIQIGKDDSSAPLLLNSATDPTTSATSANPGSTLINTTTGRSYKKLDSGSSTGWEQVNNGKFNYAINPSADTDASDTGSSANVTVTRQTSSPHRGISSYDVVVTTSAIAGNYGEINLLPTEAQDLGKRVHVNFDYSESNLVNGDIEIVIRDVTAGVNIPVTSMSSDLGVLLPTGGLTNRTKFTGSFEFDPTNIDYKLRVYVEFPPAATTTIRMSSIEVAPDVVVPGSIITPWNEYVPTFTFGPTGGLSQIEGRFRRVGDSVECMIKARKETTGTGGSVITVSIPPGLTIDTDKITGTGSAEQVFGNFIMNASAEEGTTIYSTTTTIAFYDTTGFIVATDWGDQEELAARFTVPIVGWSAGAMLSTTESFFNTALVDARNNAAEVITASVTDIPFIEVSDNTSSFDGTTFTAPKTGDYFFNGCVQMSTSPVAVIISYVNTVADKVIGQGDGTATLIPFSGHAKLIKGDDLTIRSNLGFTLAVTAVNHTWAISEQPDFSIFALYGTQEYLETMLSTNFTTVGTLAANTYVDVTGVSISLSPGLWDLGYSSHLSMQKLGGAGAMIGQIAITDSSNVVDSASVSSINQASVANTGSIGSQVSGVIRRTVTDTETFKLRVRKDLGSGLGDVSVRGTSWNGTLSNPDSTTILWARRIS